VTPKASKSVWAEQLLGDNMADILKNEDVLALLDQLNREA